MKAERVRSAIPPLLKLIWRLRLEIVADSVLSPRSVYLSQLDEQVQNNQPLTVTLPEMTKFLLSLHRAVDTVFSSISRGNRGETFVPQVSSAKMIDVAKALMGEKELEIKFTGIR
ncbi:MAG: polysaccharide biosynthesis protein, partial [Acidobacteriota bacterium]|nr:polysaccharide biosynthesis protein [Acidobacteriota bacterium]